MMDYDELVKRLRGFEAPDQGGTGGYFYNPDGPEAARAIETLRGERDEALRDAHNAGGNTEHALHQRDAALALLREAGEFVELFSRITAREDEATRASAVLAKIKEVLNVPANP